MAGCHPQAWLPFVNATLLLLVVGGDRAPSRLLDQGLSPPLPPPASGVGCTMCSSCQNPCSKNPPPLPELLPPPPPPPPEEPYTPYCPPPPHPPSSPKGNRPYPPSPKVYPVGPPGSLYPIQPYHSAAARKFAAAAPIFKVCGFVGLVVLTRV